MSADIDTFAPRGAYNVDRADIPKRKGSFDIPINWMIRCSGEQDDEDSQMMLRIFSQVVVFEARPVFTEGVMRFHGMCALFRTILPGEECPNYEWEFDMEGNLTCQENGSYRK